MIAGRIRRKNSSARWMVYQVCDRKYAEQVTAEHKVNERSGLWVIQEWDPKTSHWDNHYLDCEVYAMCVADILGARYFVLEEFNVQPRTEAKPDPTPTPEENWIGQNESWLQGG